MKSAFKTFLIAFIALPIPGRVSLLEARNVLTYLKNGGDRYIVITGLLLIIRVLLDLIFNYSFQSIIWLFTITSFIASIAFFKENLYARRVVHLALLTWQLLAGSAVTSAFTQLSFYEFLLMLSIWNILWNSEKYLILWLLLAVQASFVLADRLMLIALIVAFFVSIVIAKSLKKIILTAIIGGITVGVLNYSNYERFNRKNTVNETRIQANTSNKLIRIAIGARPDILPMLSLIYRNPLVGYGGNEDNYRYDEAAVVLNPMYHLAPDKTKERGVILHSGLLGYWVRYGLLGLMFQLALLNFAFKQFQRRKKSFPILLSFALFILSVSFEPGRNRMLMLIYLSKLFKNESYQRITSV